MRSRIFALVAIVAALALVGAGAVAFRRLAAPVSRLATVTVGAERLKLASAYLRPSGDGAAQLVAFFPDFTPAGGFADVAAATDLDDRFRAPRLHRAEARRSRARSRRAHGATLSALSR
jgi:hypothetical protein